ncbi:hypothetical protein Y032_0032g2546 [Ancylostoma ceylanicum]|uniref:Prolyl 4-hydroxylase alpha subunit domain-containing protein n=1 Tax=Ancylostoma ceylanicum TaxID=53326 RepID=A0A016UQV1_9BILA|nr:hypothetical protein Y032_0032g2546 [Ancylostoma ceylanicum]
MSEPVLKMGERELAAASEFAHRRGCSLPLDKAEDEVVGLINPVILIHITKLIVASFASNPATVHLAVSPSLTACWRPFSRTLATMNPWICASLLFLRAVVGVENEAASPQEWHDSELKMCKQSLPVYYAYSCLSYLWNYELINMELLNDEPPIVVYRDLVPKQYIKRFIADIRDEQVRNHQLLRHGYTSVRIIDVHIVALHHSPQWDNLFPELLLTLNRSPCNKRTRSNARANATELTIGHKATKGTALVFERLQRFIPFIDFATGDPWQVLVFQKGGHFAPRHEYIKVNSTKEKDDLMKKYGNRFASFSITLKKAEKGGDHLFPSIEKRYEIEVGDGMMWHSMDASKEEEYLMTHGDCPVEDGEKITATLHLRERGQYLLLSAWPDGYYDYGMLVHPNLKYRGVTRAA